MTTDRSAIKIGPPDRHGDSFRGDAQFVDEVGDFEGVFAEGCGDVGNFEGTECVHRGIFDEAHRERGGAAADAAGIFAEHDIAHPEQAVLDLSAATPEIQKPFGAGAIGRQTGDRVLDRRGRFTMNSDRPFEPEKLSQAGPVGPRDILRAGTQCATFDPTAILLQREGRTHSLTRPTFSVGGKSLSG